MSLAWASKTWALCNGQLLPIYQNQVLFWLLATMFVGTGVIQNNTITDWDNAGIHLQNNDGGATVNASAFGNIASRHREHRSHPRLCLQTTVGRRLTPPR